VKLSQLHEAFIDKAKRPMSFGGLPIKPLESGAAIIAVDKWEKVESPTRLHKTFRFSSQELRNNFITSLLEYEIKIGHNAMINIDEDKVTLGIYTKDVDQITELDKEYATFADILFKDIVYSSEV